MAQVLSGQPSCPNCGARAAAQAEVCMDCGYRFLEDRGRSRPLPWRAALAVALGAAAAVLAVVLLVSGGHRRAPDAVVVHKGPDLLSVHPLSNRAAERRLEARFTPALHDAPGAHCGALQPRPAHAIRRCRLRYPGGAVRTVVVLTNPQGHELLVRP